MEYFHRAWPKKTNQRCNSRLERWKRRQGRWENSKGKQQLIWKHNMERSCNTNISAGTWCRPSRNISSNHCHLAHNIKRKPFRRQASHRQKLCCLPSLKNVRKRLRLCLPLRLWKRMIWVPSWKISRIRSELPTMRLRRFRTRSME